MNIFLSVVKTWVKQIPGTIDRLDGELQARTVEYLRINLLNGPKVNIFDMMSLESKNYIIYTNIHVLDMCWLVSYVAIAKM